MAEDDKYVPSQGNPKLDPTKRVNDFEQTSAKFFEAENKKFSELQKLGKERAKANEEFNLDQESSSAGLLNRRLVPEGYSVGRGGVLRNVGYESTMGSMSSFGKQEPRPIKKSDISQSISHEYGQFKPKSIVMAKAASPIAGGINPWIGYGNPTICGPVRVNLYATTGGVYQSTAQESINLGMPVRIDDTWGKA